MVVVKKEYQYSQVDQSHELNALRPKKEKVVKSYKAEKIMLSLSVLIIFIMSLFLLIRYAAITEARHRVHQLNRQLEQIEAQREKLRIEVEKVSKSRWIEVQAMERLGMQYPLPEQVVYFHVNPTEVALLEKQIQSYRSKEEELHDQYQGEPVSILYIIFNKLLGLLKI